MLRRLIITLAALTAFLAPACQAGDGSAKSSTVTVAAAADLKFALDDLVTEFNQIYPVTKVSVSFGSSGNFFAQLQNGAPFDLFLSADIQYPRKLADAGLAADSVFPYAVGRLVVWAPKASSIDVTQLGIQALLEPSASKIAIANPDHAPYGRAAVAAMKALKVYDRVQPKLVFGENIAQTAQFIQSGAADIGILALSLAVAPKMREAGKYWEVPLSAYPKMEQAGVILKASRNIAGARAFRDYLLGEHGRASLKNSGFLIPGN